MSARFVATIDGAVVRAHWTILFSPILWLAVFWVAVQLAKPRLWLDLYRERRDRHLDTRPRDGGSDPFGYSRGDLWKCGEASK